MAAPLADLFTLASWGGGTDEFGNPSYTQTGVQTPAAGSTLANALTLNAPSESGSTSGVGFNVDYSKLPKTVAGTTAQGWSPWVAANQSDNSKLFDPRYLFNDPNYGWIVPTADIKHPNDALDKFGNMVPALLGAIFSAVTLNPGLLGAAFAGGGLGSLGSILFKGGENFLAQKGG